MAAELDRVAFLQRKVADALLAVDQERPGTPEYIEAARPVLVATAALVDHEAELPTLIDAPRRRTSLRTVRRVGTAVIAVAGMLALAAALGRISAGWLLLLGPQLAGGLWMTRLPVHPVGGPHLVQRQGAVLAALAVVITLGPVTGALPWWTALAPALLAVPAARMLGAGR